MNLKPNLWLLLIVLGLAALIYYFIANPTANSQPEPPIVGTPLPPTSDTNTSDIIRIVNIGQKEFKKRRAAYKQDFYDQMTAASCPGLMTSQLLEFQQDYYVLPETEVAQLYAKIEEGEKNEVPNDTVYVYPTLKDQDDYTGDRKDATLIFDLIFTVKDINGNWNFFDFTEPCPPTCKPLAPFAYSKGSADRNVKAGDNSPDIIRIVNIGQKEFDNRRNLYKQNFYSKMTMEGCPGITHNKLMYFQLDYFELPETEIAQLYAKIKEGEENDVPNDTVYVYPTLKESSGTDANGNKWTIEVFDLVFTVRDINGNWNFFDFTEPCPPTCKPLAPFSFS